MIIVFFFTVIILKCTEISNSPLDITGTNPGTAEPGGLRGSQSRTRLKRFSSSRTSSVYTLSHSSCVQLFAIPWTVARRVPLSMGFFRQEYWSGLPCPPPGGLPDPGVESLSHVYCIGRLVPYQYGHLGSPNTGL